jgi:plasmid stability protein
MIDFEGVNLDQAARALAREHAIRHGMSITGESREVVAEALDALDSMDQEAVTDLMDGEVTTLAAALQRYVEELERRDELIPTGRIITELAAILAYPYAAAES